MELLKKLCHVQYFIISGAYRNWKWSWDYEMHKEFMWDIRLENGHTETENKVEGKYKDGSKEVK
jgi:hypothetical protein